MRTTLIIILLFSSKIFFAQEGDVNVISDPRLESLIELHANYGKNLKGIPGYRIQIFFDSGNNARKKANDIKLDFMTKYPGVPSYLVYNEPHFKVRVGDFRNRFEAEYYKKIFEVDYKNIFIVHDYMTPPPIKPINLKK